jgi:hypothetical protein
MYTQQIFRSGFVLLAFAGATFSVMAQFPVKIPGLPKVEKPKPATASSSSSSASAASPSSSTSTSSTGREKRVYENEVRPSTPAVIPPRVFIQAVNSKSYWKMPNVSNVTSWLPEINAGFVYDDSSPISATAEWYNPDGSLWFTEKLLNGVPGYGLNLRSNETWELMDTKSTNAVGVFSIKIKNSATGAVMYSGKFKVNKFLNSFNASDRNKLGFYVEHDWLVPMGMVGFDDGDLTKGINSVVFSTWVKGDIKYEELEAKLFFNGSEIASRKATSGMSYDERGANVLVPLKMDELVKRWQFFFDNVQLQNGNGYNLEKYAGTHWIEKNPGQYTFKLFRNGTQIREFSFAVGTDGKFVRPAYSDSFRYPQHSILVPAKVMGNQEKWNPSVWKTDMFYGNPIAGFSIQ